MKKDHRPPKATHEGKLPVADAVLQVAVLEDGTRVISRNGMFKAFGRTKRGRALNETARVKDFPSFIDAQNLQQYIDDDLARELTEFEYTSKSGKTVRKGFKADILPRVCDVYLNARMNGTLTPQQQHLATASEIIVRSLAKVGIVALVDEATGYQLEREKEELQKILAAYINEELQPWIKRFPDEYYRQIYRLKGWPYDEKSQNRTQLLGKITNKIVYELLPDGVLEELRNLNPVNETTKNRSHKHHQFLTMDIGNPNLEKHLSQLIVLMRISKDWTDFEDHIREAFPRYGQQMKLDLEAPALERETTSAKLHSFLKSGGSDGAQEEFDIILEKASKPIQTQLP